MRKLLLSILLLLPASLLAQLITETPPALGDRYYMVRYCDGSSELKKNLSEKALRHFEDQKDVKKVTETTYAEIANAVTQRVYDYHFYFEQYIATCNPTANPLCGTAPVPVCSPSNVPGWTEALDRLMTVFSQNLTNFQSICNGPFQTSSWTGVRDTYICLYQAYFRGYTLHIAPNVRVIPVCDNREIQAHVSSAQLDFSNIAVGANPDNIQVVTDIGEYTFEFAYESDNVWRFKTWVVDNRVQYIDPPLEYGPGSPTPSCLYTPYLEDPATNCPAKCK